MVSPLASHPQGDPASLQPGARRNDECWRIERRHALWGSGGVRAGLGEPRLDRADLLVQIGESRSLVGKPESVNPLARVKHLLVTGGALQLTGLSVEAYRVEGNAYPTKIFILESNPSIDLTFKHAPSIDSLAFFSSATLIVYAYKRTDGGIYSGSSDHISITSSGPLIAMERIGGQGTQPGDVTYRCHCKALTYSIAASIPS